MPNQQVTQQPGARSVATRAPAPPPTDKALGRRGIDFKTIDEVKEFSVTARMSGIAEHLRPKPKKGGRETEAELNARHNASIFMSVCKGLRHDMDPVTAIQDSYIVHGKHSFFGKAIPAILHRSGLIAKWEERWEGSLETGDLTIITTMSRKDNGLERTERYGIEDAKRHTVMEWKNGQKVSSTLWEKDNYQNTPRDMLTWRCLNKIVKFLFADVLEGIHIAEVLRDDIQDAEFREVDDGQVEGSTAPQIEGEVAALPGMEIDAVEPAPVTDEDKGPLEGSDETAPAEANVREEFLGMLRDAKTKADVQSALAFLDHHSGVFDDQETYDRLRAEGDDVHASMD